PSTEIQRMPQAIMAAQGAPLLRRRPRKRGAQPSWAIASGRRDSESVNELKMPKVLTSAAMVMAEPSAAPPSVAEIAIQLPVVHASTGTPACQTAKTGTI